MQLLAFYASRGWSTDDLDRAAKWSPAEREFYRIARNQYWYEQAELMTLMADRIALSMSLHAEDSSVRQHQNEWRSWLEKQCGLTTGKEDD